MIVATLEDGDVGRGVGANVGAVGASTAAVVIGADAKGAVTGALLHAANSATSAAKSMVDLAWFTENSPVWLADAVAIRRRSMGAPTLANYILTNISA